MLVNFIERIIFAPGAKRDVQCYKMLLVYTTKFIHLELTNALLRIKSTGI